LEPCVPPMYQESHAAHVLAGRFAGKGESLPSPHDPARAWGER